MALQSDSSEMQYMTLLYLKLHTYLIWITYLKGTYTILIFPYKWAESGTSQIHVDEHKVAINLIGSNTFIPGEKGCNGRFEQPHT